MSRGRHARPSRAAKVAGTAAAAGAVTAVAAAALPGQASASIIYPQHVVPGVQQVTHAAADRHTVKRKPSVYTVRSGDYLSKIASRLCGDPSDWTGLFLRNRKLIGNDPDLVLPGQRLVLDCRQGQVFIPAVTVQSQASPPVQHQAPSQPQTGQQTSTVVHHLTYQGSDPSGVLTRDQVGQLWLDAGGPAWAETQAENVAYCESGFNTFAYNPSGASGLWQILGEVVPGNVFDARVNAENAVSKFEASGDTWAQWVCQP